MVFGPLFATSNTREKMVALTIDNPLVALQAATFASGYPSTLKTVWGISTFGKTPKEVALELLNKQQAQQARSTYTYVDPNAGKSVIPALIAGYDTSRIVSATPEQLAALQGATQITIDRTGGYEVSTLSASQGANDEVVNFLNQTGKAGTWTARVPTAVFSRVVSTKKEAMANGSFGLLSTSREFLDAWIAWQAYNPSPVIIEDGLAGVVKGALIGLAGLVTGGIATAAGASVGVAGAAASVGTIAAKTAGGGSINPSDFSGLAGATELLPTGPVANLGGNMGFDIGQVFGNAKSAIEQGMNDVLKQGGNAALGWLEGEAINLLSADKADKEKAFSAGVVDILNRPTASGSLGSYIGNQLQSPVMKNYGPYIIAGIGAIGVLALVIFSRRH